MKTPTFALILILLFFFALMPITPAQGHEDFTLDPALTALAESLATPTASHSGQQLLGTGRMCINAPTSIVLGNTETIEVEITLEAEAELPDNCRALQIYEDMGIGLAGMRLDNFVTDPSEVHMRARIQTGSVNQWTWIIRATGEAGSRHNVIVFAFVDDETRTTGYRSIATLPIRVEITDTFSLGTFLDTALGRVAAVAGAIIAIAGAIAAVVKFLPKGKPD